MYERALAYTEPITFNFDAILRFKISASSNSSAPSKWDVYIKDNFSGEVVYYRFGRGSLNNDPHEVPLLAGSYVIYCENLGYYPHDGVRRMTLAQLLGLMTQIV